MNITNNRIIALLGAGAVLDFDFDELKVKHKPATSVITDELAKICVKDVDGNSVALIEELVRLYKEANFETQNPAITPMARYGKRNPINFEVVLHILEELQSYSSVWKNEWISPAVVPPMAAFVKAKLNYDTVVYSRSIDESVRVITRIIEEYDEAFRKTDKESWYREFWKSNLGPWDVFNLNYDSTVEQCIGDYEDGFEREMDTYGGHRFIPGKLIGNTVLSTVVHPHGSIYYGPRIMPEWSADEDYLDLRKYNTLEQAKYAHRFGVGKVRNQAREELAQGAILVGLRKTDKLTYFPNSVYHNHLMNTILKNGRVLIVGYSFGDKYINNMLHKLHAIHQGKERVVLVDKWRWNMHNPMDLYAYTLGRHEAAGGEIVFICQYLGMSPMETDHEMFCSKFGEVKPNSPIYSNDGRLLLFVNGFKEACKHKEEIFEFLNS